MDFDHLRRVDPLTRPDTVELARITRLLDTGRYRIEPSEVAEAMLREVLGPLHRLANPRVP